MSHARTEGRDPQELFAEFLERNEADPSLTFERWVEGYATNAAELRGLYAAYVQIQPHLAASKVPVENSA